MYEHAKNFPDFSIYEYEDNNNNGDSSQTTMWRVLGSALQISFERNSIIDLQIFLRSVGQIIQGRIRTGSIAKYHQNGFLCANDWTILPVDSPQRMASL